MKQLIHDGNMNNFCDNQDMQAFYMGFIHQQIINTIGKYHADTKMSDPVDTHCQLVEHRGGEGA